MSCPTSLNGGIADEKIELDSTPGIRYLCYSGTNEKKRW